ncbi:hypothetical protein BGX28_002922 [Mortierella sp. GBA30]|nr:hypothetical protein BGX28_002922 [Mortierella sp. GBA30]
MPNDGPLDTLPISPCTDGSLGFGPEYLGTAPIKDVENPTCDSVIERTAVIADAKEGCNEEMSDKKQDDSIEEIANIEQPDAKDTAEVLEDEEQQEEESTAEKGIELKELTEKTVTLEVSTPYPRDDLTEEASLPVADAAILTPQANEPMASGIPNRAVRSGLPTHAQMRGLSAASQALKKKQAAENAAAALKAMAVEIPETGSISNRIQMFGGGNANRGLGSKKFNVRDMVQKFKDVEEKNHDEIAHVEKGHNNVDPRGMCSAYSLSTASRPVRPTPRRKMSHELTEEETRNLGARKHQDDRMGVVQESVQRVRNAKSLFENLARPE